MLIGYLAPAYSARFVLIDKIMQRAFGLLSEFRSVSTVSRNFVSVIFTLEQLKHPGKTFIGCTPKGFGFLGYHFSLDGRGRARLMLASKTITNFTTRLSRLYEQSRIKRRKKSPAAAEATIYIYQALVRLGHRRAH